MSARPERSDSRPRVTHVVPALFGADGGVIGGAERYALYSLLWQEEKLSSQA